MFAVIIDAFILIGTVGDDAAINYNIYIKWTNIFELFSVLLM